MGRIGVVKSFERKTDEGENVSEVKIDVGGSEILLPPHFSAPGLDSAPLPDDYVATIDAPGSARQAAVGYADPANEQKAEDGEFRAYGRDPDGAEVSEIWLKGDGSIVVSNEKATVTIAADGGVLVENEGGTFELKADGQLDVNGGNWTVDP